MSDFKSIRTSIQARTLFSKHEDTSVIHTFSVQVEVMMCLVGLGVLDPFLVLRVISRMLRTAQSPKVSCRIYGI